MLEELHEPTETQRIVVVLGLLGGNLVQVQDAESREFLCRVPAKFRNVVWIKKGRAAARAARASARVCERLSSGVPAADVQ
eukprot:2697335-Prymnesium_polylepis.1